MRTLIFSDIHGKLEALEKALKAAKFDIKKDRLICLGDYVDGWDQSFEVVDKLLTIKQQSKQENIFLLGNHDKWFADILNEDFEHFRDEQYIKDKYDHWYKEGGQATYASYLKYADEDILRHKREFYDTLLYYFEEDNKLFVHAGFSVTNGFRKTLKEDKRELLWNRSLNAAALNHWQQNKDKKVANRRFDDFEKIYIGHTPTLYAELDEPRYMGNVINVDQGCKLTGLLTIWIDETDTFYQNK